MLIPIDQKGSMVSEADVATTCFTALEVRGELRKN